MTHPVSLFFAITTLDTTKIPPVNGWDFLILSDILRFFALCFYAYTAPTKEMTPKEYLALLLCVRT